MMLTSLISAGYYVHVVRVMFLGARPANLPNPQPAPFPTRFMIGAAAVLIVLFGLFPGQILDWSRGGSLLPPAFMTPVTQSPAEK
jgi:NADH:ubiquinone oxidoreductase subunit 2 (subunit N)